MQASLWQLKTIETSLIMKVTLFGNLKANHLVHDTIFELDRSTPDHERVPLATQNTILTLVCQPIMRLNVILPS